MILRQYSHHLNLYCRHCFPLQIINVSVWLYFRFSLSYRDVELLMAKRLVVISYETGHQECLKFGQTFANDLHGRCHVLEIIGRMTKA